MVRIRKKSGFTLVEIMIVVTIIGILSGIAIPNYLSARQATASNACIANLRRLDSSIQMFQLDNGVWPDAFDDLSPYIRNVPTTCPADGAAYILNPSVGDNPAYSECPNHGNLTGL